MLAVVKVGSSTLVGADGNIDYAYISGLCQPVAALMGEGHRIVVVSSGAVASGRSELHLPSTETERMDSVEQRQLFSAVGQAKLMGRYVEFFRDHGIHVGQVLTTKENFSTPRQNENQRQCMQAMLDHDVLPIVNENDTVCITELMFTDNDELSGLIARLMGCQALVILSNVDGLYDGTPSSPEARLIREVRAGQDIAQYISQEHSSAGRGGMESKCHIALAAAQAGIHVYIANGTREHVLTDLLLSPTPSLPFTHFLP